VYLLFYSFRHFVYNGEKELEGEPLLVPLTVPLVAGSSLHLVLLLFSTSEPQGLFKLLTAAFLA